MSYELPEQHGLEGPPQESTQQRSESPPAAITITAMNEPFNGKLSEIE